MICNVISISKQDYFNAFVLPGYSEVVLPDKSATAEGRNKNKERTEVKTHVPLIARAVSVPASQIQN